MTNFKVPTRQEVSEENQLLFDQLHNMVGFVPNIYAFMANSDTALATYLNFENGNNLKWCDFYPPGAFAFRKVDEFANPGTVAAFGAYR